MNLPAIDEITSVITINDWVEKWEKECLNIDPKDPIKLYDENGFLHSDPIICEMYEKINKVIELLCRIKNLNQQINRDGNYKYNFPTSGESERLKSERIRLYNELSDLVQEPKSSVGDNTASLPETHHITDFSHIKKTANFDDVIQYQDKAKLKKRLHELIDGKRGADVGCVFLHARMQGYITRNPTQSEFVNEFDLKGSWSAIKNYMSDNNQNALERSNRIVIFE